MGIAVNYSIGINPSSPLPIEKFATVEHNGLSTANLLVIIPAYNEASNIAFVVDELRSYIGQDADILVIDDCSEDGTQDILKKLGVVFISLPFNLGYAGALQAGYKYALANNYDYVVQFDGDGQHIAKEIETLFFAYQNGSADIIIGSRFVASGESHRSFLKRIATAIFCYLIKIISGSTLHDPTSGFQLLNRKAYERYSKVHNFPYYPDANIIIEMLLNGYRVQEVQVEMRRRILGESMHDGLVRQAKYMIRIIYSIFIITLKYLPSALNKKIRV